MNLVLLIKRLADLVSDQINVVIGINVGHLGTVVLKHRGSLLVELVQAGTKLLLSVITTLDQGLTSDIVNTSNLGRVEPDVVRATRRRVDQAASDTLNQQLIVNVQVDNTIDGLTLLLQEIIQDTSLVDGTRETIQDETLAALRTIDGLSDDTSDDIITNQLASLHDGLGLATHLGTILHGFAKHVTGGQVAQAVLLLDARSLGSLASTRRTKEDSSPMKEINQKGNKIRENISNQKDSTQHTCPPCAQRSAHDAQSHE